MGLLQRVVHFCNSTPARTAGSNSELTVTSYTSMYTTGQTLHTAITHMMKALMSETPVNSEWDMVQETLP